MIVLRIKGFEIKVSFFALALVSLLVVSNRMTGLLLCFLSVLIHELGHLFAMLLCKCEIYSLQIAVFDIRIIQKSRYGISLYNDLFITLSGPFSNLLFYFLLSGICPELAYINLSLGLFNLLPASSLDGGRALFLILNKPLGAEKSSIVVDIITIIISIPLFAAGFFILLRTRYNFSLLFVGLYLFFGVFIRKDKYL